MIDLWDGRAFHSLLFALLSISEKTEDGNFTIRTEKQIDDIISFLGLTCDRETFQNALSLFSAWPNSAFSSPFLPLTVPLPDVLVSKAKEAFLSAKDAKENVGDKVEKMSKVVLTWTDAPELLNATIPEVRERKD